MCTKNLWLYGRSAFNFNNYGNDKYISYELTDVYTNVNTDDNSCIDVKLGCLDIKAYNYNDFDFDGEPNASLDPLSKNKYTFTI